MTAPTRPGDGVTILVVDDESGVRRACARVLKSDGFDVLLAESGQEALTLLAEHPNGIQLAIIDVVMPGMTGLELARRLRERWRGTKVLFMSGYASTETGSLVSMDPAAQFLGKPFSADVLRRKVHEMIGGASAPGA